ASAVQDASTGALSTRHAVADLAHMATALDALVGRFTIGDHHQEERAHFEHIKALEAGGLIDAGAPAEVFDTPAIEAGASDVVVDAAVHWD
ncbi:MAG: hypothetical protein JWL70_759, partial [Acidimicrobiia bacterium]|nr:hypothetical protein [Acidimicrobiia bacterium]